MGNSKTSSFIVTRRIYTNIGEEHFLDSKMNAVNKMYNTAAKHYKEVVENFKKDEKYIKAYKNWKNSKDDEELCKKYSKEIFKLAKEYGLSEYAIHSYMAYNKTHAFEGCLGINIVQKIGSQLWTSIKKVLFNDTKIHYRKKGQTASFEDKRTNSGIIYNKNTNCKSFR